MKIKTFILVSISLFLTGCSGGKANIDDTTIVVGASSTPHAQILEQTRSYLKGKGYDLEIKVMTDYVTPNISLKDGDLDANYFQHEPYLLDFIANYNTDLVCVEKIHFEPMTIFSGGNSSSMKIAIPNDKSNSDRARALLNSNMSVLTQTLDLYTIVEVDAATVPLMKDDVSYIVVNGNYGLQSGLFENDTPIASEGSGDDIAFKMANIIATRKGCESKTAIQVLVESLKQENIKNYINKTYKGAVIPMF